MRLEDDLENLALIPIFSVFEPEALRQIAFSSETRLLRAGDVLFRRGDPSDGGYVLTAGSLALDMHDDGRPAEHVLRPWTLIGETALLAPSTRPGTAIALGPTTALKISRAQFREILEQYPATAMRTHAYFRDRLMSFTAGLSAEFEQPTQLAV